MLDEQAAAWNRHDVARAMDLSIATSARLFRLREMIDLGLVLIPIGAAAEMRSTSPA